MRLTALVLERYGPFAEARITLDPAPGRLNLLVARNGAGKSVLRQAFSDLLFGIGGQTAMGFRHGYAGMTLRAEIIVPPGMPAGTPPRARDGTQHGTPGVLVRRKGQGNTLVDADGAPVAASALAALLGGADRGLLERLFSLDTAALRRGADELLASGGELADALLAATGQLHKARDQLGELEGLRDAAAPLRRNAGRPFYQGIDALAAARKTRREVRRPEEWHRREAEADAAEAAQEAANAAERDASARLAAIERVRRTRPLLAERDAAQLWLDAHPDAPVLPPGLPLRLAQRLAAAREAARLAADRLAEACRRQDLAAAAAAAVAPDAALLAEAEAIAALGDMAGAARQAEGDLPIVAGENAAATGKLATLLGALGTDLPPARAATLLPPHPARAEATRLIERHRELAGQVGKLPGLIAAREAERAALAGELAVLPGGGAPGRQTQGPQTQGPQTQGTEAQGTEAQNTETLEPLLREIGRDGEPGAREVAAAGRAQALRVAAATALARLPAGLDPVAPLPASPAALERLLRALEAARAARDAAERDAEAQRTRLAVTTRRLSALAAALAGPEAADATLPDVAAVAAARRHRDAGWQLVFRQAFTPAPPDAAELGAWAGTEPLPLAFARAVAAADRVADRRAAEAERLAEAATLERNRTEAAAALDDAVATNAAAAAREAAARKEWLAACAPLALGAEATPAELHEALAAREAALAATQGARLAETEAEALAGRHAGWAARLAPLLHRSVPHHGVLHPGASDGLPALLAAAETLGARERTVGAERARLGGRLDAMDAQLAGWRTELAEATRLLAGWSAAWREALRGLGRPEGESPHATATALGLLAELETAVADGAQREERQRGMRARLDRFATVAAALADRLGLPAGPDPFTAARRLAEALGAAEQATARRGELDRACAAAQAEAAGAEAALREATAALGGVLAAAGAADEESAAIRLALAAEAEARHAALRDSTARLREAGDGLSPDRLRETAAAIAPEALPAETEAARAAQQAAAAAAQSAARTAALLREALARDAAAEPQAAAAEAAALAGIGRSLEDALLLHAAAALLRHGLLALEADADTTLIRRIGEAFGALTDGEYDGVALAHAARGSGTLMPIEHAFPNERREVAQLSEGTRDQLYLALRLVAIEDHARTAPPLPFLADDVLQTFDDRRAAATLRALLALSHTTQVVVLTHHEHLVRLAEGLPVNLQRL